MTGRTEWFVYLAPDYSDRCADRGLSDAAYRLHLSGLCFIAQRGGLNQIPLHRVRRLVPTFRRSALGELLDLRWWQADGDLFRVNHDRERSLDPKHMGKPLWKVSRNLEVRPAIPKAVRTLVFGRDGHECVECGARNDLTLDHIHPYSLGGSDEPDNLRTLCRPCNSSKGARV